MLARVNAPVVLSFKLRFSPIQWWCQPIGHQADSRLTDQPPPNERPLPIGSPPATAWISLPPCAAKGVRCKMPLFHNAQGVSGSYMTPSWVRAGPEVPDKTLNHNPGPFVKVIWNRSASLVQHPSDPVWTTYSPVQCLEPVLTFLLLVEGFLSYSRPFPPDSRHLLTDMVKFQPISDFSSLVWKILKPDPCPPYQLKSMTCFIWDSGICNSTLITRHPGAT